MYLLKKLITFKVDLSQIKDIVFISTLCYNVYLNKINAEILNKQNLAVVELCEKMSLRMNTLEQKPIFEPSG